MDKIKIKKLANIIGGGGAAPAFNPLTDVTSGTLIQWAESDRTLYQDDAETTPADANNDPVGAIVDAANGHDYLQGTAGNRPLFKTNIIGSMPAVFFDGLDDFLNTTSFASGIGFDGYTLFLSIMANVDGTQRGFLARGVYAPTFVYTSTGQVDLYVGSNNLYDTVLDANPHILCFRRPNGGSVATRLYVDGVLDAANPNLDVSNWTAAALSLGCIDGAGLQPYSGYWFGTGLFAGALSDEDMANCTNYLLKKLALL